MIQAVQTILSGTTIEDSIKEKGKITGSDSFVYTLDAAKRLIEANISSEMETKSLTNDFITGKNDDIASLLIAQEKSGILLQYTMQVRNGVLNSFKEIMNLSV